MKPAPFDYARPDTLNEALELLREHGDDARVLAGGQSLLPMLNMRLSRPKILIDVMHVPELATVREEKGVLVVPAGVRQAKLLAQVTADDRFPLLAKAMPWIGHAQTRARGTVCGSIAHADPSAELPLCLMALGGKVRLRAARKKREVAAAEFFSGMMSTAKLENEMIEAVVFPVAQPGEGFAFTEFGRRHGDFAIVSCAAKVTKETIELTIGGVADVPTQRRWGRLAPDALSDALNELAWSLEARDDLHADARLRRDLVRALGLRTIDEAAACCR